MLNRSLRVRYTPYASMDFCVLKQPGLPTRKYDIHYDKTIVVSGPRDYYREARKAMDWGTEYVLCPHYETMFSDVRPRHVMKVKNYGRAAEPFNKWIATKEKVEGITLPPVDVKGGQRALFFKQPLLPYLHPPAPTALVRLQETHVSTQTLPSGDGLYPQPRRFTLKSIMRKARATVPAPPPSGNLTHMTRSTQTDYRDSEAQTLPWAHDFVSLRDEDVPVLAMSWFRWEENMPAGEEEVALIERFRQKEAWENAFPVVTDKNSDIRRKSLLSMIETNDMAFRESQIESVHQIRIDLSQRKLERDSERLEWKIQDRLRRQRANTRENSLDKIKYMRHQLLRSMRKLTLAHKKINKKYFKCDIVSLHADKASELYAPQLRFGEDPSRSHETIDIHCRFLKRYRGLEMLDEHASKTPPSKVQGFDFKQASQPKVAGICVRATILTEEGLQRLHSELKAIRSKLEEKLTQHKLTLRESLPSPGEVTPAVADVDELENDLFQAALILAKTVRGRAAQTNFMTKVIKLKEFELKDQVEKESTKG